MELYRELYYQIPEFLLAERVCQGLWKHGHTAYLAGGCVRDFLLKRQPQDFDVATSASPDQVEKIFQKTVSVGKDFGVIVVVEEPEGGGETLSVEVATFRKDGKYEDGRRPVSVEFSEAKEDALRRDLTVNALFFDLQKNEVIDYVQGDLDLRSKTLKAVGDPEKRFQEDHLRILRTIRFSGQLGFEIEAKTWEACQKLAPLIQKVSGERIQDELTKLLGGAFLEMGLQNLFDSQVLKVLVGQPNLQWKEPRAYFSSSINFPGNLEARWFDFFLWISQIMPADGSLSFFESLANQWKFSKDLKSKTLKALSWVFEQKAIDHRSLGELLALSFEPDNERGIRSYAQLFIQESENALWKTFLVEKKKLGNERPEPLVTAADLINEFKGPELGKALKFCYYRQLEGKLNSKSELIHAWRQHLGNS